MLRPWLRSVKPTQASGCPCSQFGWLSWAGPNGVASAKGLAVAMESLIRLVLIESNLPNPIQFGINRLS
jgi:hypothetical protein